MTNAKYRTCGKKGSILGYDAWIRYKYRIRHVSDTVIRLILKYIGYDTFSIR